MAAGSVALAALLTATLLQAPAVAACDAPVPSATQPGYSVADPDCDVDGTPFTPIAGSAVHTGIEQGAAYRIEVPRRWNGRLVIFAHGFRGGGRVVFVSNPSLREHYLDRGYAWAASSYQLNGYEVGQGVRDSHALIALFGRVTGTPARSVLMTGESMGGHVTAVAIERHPRAFTGAMPVCGVLGDTALWDHFLDANVTAAALAGVPIRFPDVPSESYDAEWRAQVAEIVTRLGPPASLTPAGRAWSDVVERRTGGERPGFDASFAYWNTARSLEPFADLPFLFGLYPGLSGRAENVSGNRQTVYRITDGPRLTPAERRLNAEVLRVSPGIPGGDAIPRVHGRPRVPVLSLHTTGDLFVPFSMEQIYARRAHTPLFVSRAIRAPGHCDFTQAELRTGFDDLTRWIATGHRATGDAILNPRAVAAPSFGCRFTTETRAGFPPCSY
ncbi:pimeloyl-ACP methyl ester carboxylesterase [Catenuloplanes nepalensis]|uniref:Pimeloyl-ACP methyl ester carboxylesterase n=1 Tax=Catenuloplanes nepalensis TaxID=587533 RepID=A0ABT9MYB7_9ACTN|nr:phthalyl amidase [Catenuloplanes nepalensis]MDP9796399.1 pimeloyl-ACP methyl ester carboxylesterase [Catenuloplanes nepalensis]